MENPPGSTSLSVKLTLAVSLVTTMMLIACSPAHGLRHREISLKQKLANSNSALGPDTWSDLKKIFSHFAVKGRLTSEQITKLFAKYKPEMSAFIQSALEKTPQSDYSFDEFSAALESSYTTLTWSKFAKIDDEVSRIAALKLAYPEAHAPVLVEFAAEVSRVLPPARKAKPSELIKLGVFLSDAKAKPMKGPVATLTNQLFNKQLWLMAPDLDLAQLSTQDRELTNLIVSLKFAEASKSPSTASSTSATAPASSASNTTASAEAAQATTASAVASAAASGTSSAADPTGTEAQPAAGAPESAQGKMRTLHQRFYREIALLSAVTPNVDDERAISTIEELDWSLNLRLSTAIPTESKDGLPAHLRNLNPQLFQNWDASHPFIVKPEAATPASLLQDLFMASTTDVLLNFCQLSPPANSTHESVQIFLYRFSQMNLQADGSSTACKQIDSALHPDSVTYELWRMKAFMSGGS